MLPELRAYERLSPELVLLAESHNPNVEGTLITDYLVTGARGYDWLLQIHRDAVIVDFEDMQGALSNMKSAVDELVEYPSIIRVLILIEGDKRTPLFVVTDLGAEGPEMVTKINALLEKKNKTMTDKRVITLNVPLDCKDPVGYVRDTVDTFMATHGEPGVDLDIRVKPNDEAMRKLLLAEVPNINVEDAYPKPGEVNVEAIRPAPVRGELKHFIAVDDAAFTGQPIAVDMVKEYTPLIRDWAKARNIIGGGSSALDQFIKGLTEAGELWTHIGKGQRDLMRDDIGDVYVCLVNAAGNLDINLEDHVRPLEKYNVHSGRSSYQVKGLKRWSLQVLYGMAGVAQSIENVLESDNGRDVDFFKSDFSEACADVVYALETIALENDWTLSECVIEAYEDIRDRRGLMNDGCFVKEKDFTHEMVNRVIADGTTANGTREYLNTWLANNRAEIAVPLPETAEQCLQELSDQTQEHEAYLVKQAGNIGAAKGMIANIEGNEVVVTLGLFGLPNRANEVFIIDADKLNANLNKIVGTHIGETSSPSPNERTVDSWLKRIETVEVANSAGVLKEAAVIDHGHNGHGHILEVIGRVDLSDRGLDMFKHGSSFGIRSVVAPTSPAFPKILNVIDVTAFDLVTENPRPFGFVSILDKIK